MTASNKVSSKQHPAKVPKEIPKATGSCNEVENQILFTILLSYREENGKENLPCPNSVALWKEHKRERE
jgi:hypothetical protein